MESCRNYGSLGGAVHKNADTEYRLNMILLLARNSFPVVMLDSNKCRN